MPSQETWRRAATFGKYRGTKKTWYQIALSDPGYVYWMEAKLRNDPEWASMARFLDRLVSAMDALPLSSSARCAVCGQPPTVMSIAGNARVGYSVSPQYVYCAEHTDCILAHNATLYPIGLRTAAEFRHGSTDHGQVMRTLKVLLDLPERLTARAAWECLEPAPTPSTTTPSHKLVALSR